MYLSLQFLTRRLLGLLNAFLASSKQPVGACGLGWGVGPELCCKGLAPRPAEQPQAGFSGFLGSGRRLSPPPPLFPGTALRFALPRLPPFRRQSVEVVDSPGRQPAAVGELQGQGERGPPPASRKGPPLARWLSLLQRSVVRLRPCHGIIFSPVVVGGMQSRGGSGACKTSLGGGHHGRCPGSSVPGGEHCRARSGKTWPAPRCFRGVRELRMVWGFLND